MNKKTNKFGLKKNAVKAVFLKKVILTIAYIVVANILYAGGSYQGEIARTDLTKIPSQGESEIIFNYVRGTLPVSIYINGQLQAQCFPNTSDSVRNEKVIVKNGSIRIDFVLKERMSSGPENNKTYYWEERRREILVCEAKSSSITIDIETDTSNRFTRLEVVKTVSLEGTPVVPSEGNTVQTGNSSVSGNTENNGTIEMALTNASKLLIETLPKNSTLAVLNIASNNEDMAIFVVEELEFILVNSKTNNFSIVDRKSLDKIRSEKEFQMSAEVDDDSAVSIGKLLGASIVLTGNISGSGSLRRLRIKALDVLTGKVVAMASERF